MALYIANTAATVNNAGLARVIYFRPGICAGAGVSQDYPFYIF